MMPRKTAVSPRWPWPMRSFNEAGAMMPRKTTPTSEALAPVARLQ